MPPGCQLKICLKTTELAWVVCICDGTWPIGTGHVGTSAAPSGVFGGALWFLLSGTPRTVWAPCQRWTGLWDCSDTQKSYWLIWHLHLSVGCAEMRLYEHELQGDLDSNLVSAIYKLSYLDDVNTSLQDLVARERVFSESWDAKGRYFFFRKTKELTLLPTSPALALVRTWPHQSWISFWEPRKPFVKNKTKQNKNVLKWKSMVC